MADNSHQSAAEVAAVVQSSGDPSGHLIQQQPDQLQMFWASQREEIQQINNFKNHKLPISRIRKIMKSGRDVRMISGEAPILLAKACELMILQFSLRAWLQAQEYKRRTLKKTDFMDAIRQTEVFDFLVDVFSRDEIKEEATGLWPGMGGPTSGDPPMELPAPPTRQPAPSMGQPAPPMVQPAPSMGQPGPSGMMTPRRAMPWVTLSRYVQPTLQAWQSHLQAAEDNPSATGGNSGQGNL